ncbi:MAG: exodeoxyribonuclease VII small subunit [Lachnospira sp.]|nr:exodeoxyribonuclease VII small subunit [Lachnospira sp.]
MAKALTLEESFEKLEQIIGQMEAGNTSLDDTFKLYNEGIKLVKNCNGMLDKVEKQIVIINGGEDTEDGI